VLEERSAFEHRDLGHPPFGGTVLGVLDVHAHEIPTKRAAFALTTPPTLEHVVVELERVGVDKHGLYRR
jgi:hypothetical protein